MSANPESTTQDTTQARVEVTESAVLKRVRRRLARDSKRIAKDGDWDRGATRGWLRPPGRPAYAVVDFRNIVVDGFDERSLEWYARKIGVLKATEFVGN